MKNTWSVGDMYSKGVRIPQCSLLQDTPILKRTTKGEEEVEVVINPF
jgi:hypothetical protein